MVQTDIPNIKRQLCKRKETFPFWAVVPDTCLSSKRQIQIYPDKDVKSRIRTLRDSQKVL